MDTTSTLERVTRSMTSMTRATASTKTRTRVTAVFNQCVCVSMLIKLLHVEFLQNLNGVIAL